MEDIWMEKSLLSQFPFVRSESASFASMQLLTVSFSLLCFAGKNPSFDLQNVGNLRVKADLLSCHLNRIFSFPTKCMCSTVRIAVLVHHVRNHGIQNSGVHRSCGLHVQIKWRPSQSNPLHLHNVICPLWAQGFIWRLICNWFIQ